MNVIRPLFAVALFAAIAGGCGSSGEAVENGQAISSIDISPNQTTISKGATQQFHATARYADGTTKDVTNDVVWDSSAPSVATVTKNGTVSTAKPGIVDITANYDGMKGSEHFIVTP